MEKLPVNGDIHCPSISLKGKEVRHDLCSGTAQFLCRILIFKFRLQLKAAQEKLVQNFSSRHATKPHLTKPVEILKISLVKSIPHNLNVHVI